MRDAGRERWRQALHLALAGLVLWLVASSPWLELYRRLTPQAGWVAHAHVWLGLATFALSLLYLASCLRGGRWRLYFPWAGGDLAALRADLAALARGRLPSAEGGGLLALVEGLLLLAVVATGLTGVLWLATAGTNEALAWRQWHIGAARATVALLAAHLAGVVAHWLQLARG